MGCLKKGFIQQTRPTLAHGCWSRTGDSLKYPAIEAWLVSEGEKFPRKSGKYATWHCCASSRICHLSGERNFEVHPNRSTVTSTELSTLA